MKKSILIGVLSVMLVMIFSGCNNIIGAQAGGSCGAGCVCKCPTVMTGGVCKITGFLINGAEQITVEKGDNLAISISTNNVPDCDGKAVFVDFDRTSGEDYTTDPYSNDPDYLWVELDKNGKTVNQPARCARGAPVGGLYPCKTATWDVTVRIPNSAAHGPVSLTVNPPGTSPAGDSGINLN